MKQVTISDVKRLITVRAEPAISIYMRTEGPAGAPSNRARLRELLRRTSRLLEVTLPRRRVDELLAPVVERARAGWPDAPGIAFLRAPGISSAFALPVEVPDLAVVSSAFHTKPLVGLLDGADRFVLLALAPESASLYEGSPRELRPMAGATPLRREAGVASEAWFQTVDDAVRELLWDRGDPVVLAGAADDRAGYGAAAHYPWVLDDGIECDLEQIRVGDLHAPAKAIVEAHRAHVEAEAVSRYLSAARSEGATSEDLEEVCRAAAVGRVPLLLHRRGAHVWGSVDRLTGACRVSASRRPQAGDGDVIDDICQLVLQSGGDVVEIARERMPFDAPLGAVIPVRARMPVRRERHRVQEVTL